MNIEIETADPRQISEYLTRRREAVIGYIKGFGLPHLVAEPHLKNFILSYPLRGGKSLRPAFVALAAGAVSGKNEDQRTLPLQGAIELYHNWTLIHDDIIDEDDFRRGKPSLHREIEAEQKRKGSQKGSEKYGRDIAILVGDLLQSSVNLLILKLIEEGVKQEVVLSILRLMHAELTPALVDGEARDVRFSLERPGDVSEDEVLAMLEGKTAALFEFCGTAGALVGLNNVDLTHSSVKALAAFSRLTGIAFQIQDDILGVVGDEDKLGKPRGSDLREGKQTLLLLHAYKHGTESQKKQLKAFIGKQDLKPEEIDKIEQIFINTGAIDHVKSIAREYLINSISFLNDLEPSSARTMLAGLGRYMIEREF